MSAALITEIIAGVPIVASAIVSIIVALKANAKTNANTTQIANHIEDPSHP